MQMLVVEIYQVESSEGLNQEPEREFLVVAQGLERGGDHVVHPLHVAHFYLGTQHLQHIAKLRYVGCKLAVLKGPQYIFLYFEAVSLLEFLVVPVDTIHLVCFGLENPEKCPVLSRKSFDALLSEQLVNLNPKIALSC